MSATPTIHAQQAATSGDSPGRPQSLLIRGVAFNWGSLVIVAAVSILLTPIMIRSLGQYYYGMWVLIMSVVDQYGLLDMGLGSTLSRYAGYFKGAEQRCALDEILSTSLAFTGILAVAASLVTFVVALWLPTFFGFTGTSRPTFTWLALLLGLTTAFAFPERIMAAYLRGLQRFDLPNIISTSAVIVRGALIVTAFWCHYGIITVAAITMLVGLASATLHYAMIHTADPLLSVRFENVSWKRLRELFTYSVYVFIGNLGVRLTSRIDSIVIARVLTVAAITPFSIGSRLMDYFAGIFGGVQGPLLSSMSELDGRSDRSELQRLFLRSTRFSLLLSLLLGSLLIFDGRSLLRIWLARTDIDLNLSYQVLIVLVSCYVAGYAQLSAGTIIYARARHQLLAWIVLGEGVANLALSIYWARPYGIVGVAMGTAVPALISHIFIVPWYALRVIGLSPYRYLRESFVRPVASNCLFAAFCFFISGPAQSPARLGFTVVCQLFVFLLSAYFIGLPIADTRMIKLKLSLRLPHFFRFEEAAK